MEVKLTMQFFTTKQLAERYGLSKAGITNLANSGKFPTGIRLGRSRRWPVEDVEAFEARQRQEKNAANEQ